MHQCSRLCIVNRTVIADAPPGELLDSDVWMRAFEVRADNPILRVLGVAA